MTTQGQGKPGQAVGIPAGDKIGKYEVLRRLAIGGQAIVYQCKDPMLDRLVAVKQISTHLAEDANFLARFRKEAQVLARVGSTQPAVVTIHELIEDPRGLFIVMEFVEGPSLEQVLADNPGPVETKAVLQVLWRLAAALHDVHAAGIVHRDIKPGNIIVCPGLRPKITDFGVAATMTGQTSMVLGTTKYMAPELSEGGQVDGRADMYSLGFIAYEMLVGREKFNEIFADIVRDKHSEALRWMKWHGNESLSAPPVSEVNPAVPDKLSDIVARMIAKDPDQRFESMEQLGRAIKTTFSPKARPAAPVPAGPGGAVLDSVRHGGGIGPEDEGDRLVVTQEPATAPLPKSSLSTRTKLVLAGVAVAALVAIGIIFGVQQHRDEQRRVEQAQGMYAQAANQYTQRDYDAALKGFTVTAERYGDTVAGHKAQVMAHLAGARLALESSQWPQLSQELSQAGERLRRLQSRSEEGSALYDWTRKVDQEVADFEIYQALTRGFREAVAAARNRLAEGQYDQARKVFEEDVRRPDGVLLGLSVR